MVTISWIQAQKKEFKFFVENRVQEIRKNSRPIKIGTIVNLLTTRRIYLHAREQLKILKRTFCGGRGQIF